LGALAAQPLHACPDHRKIVSGAGSDHVFTVFLVDPDVSYPAAAGALFLTLPTRALTGEQII